MVLEKNTYVKSSDLRSSHQMDLVARLNMLDRVDEDGVSDLPSKYLAQRVIQVLHQFYS